MIGCGKQVTVTSIAAERPDGKKMSPRQESISAKRFRFSISGDKLAVEQAIIAMQLPNLLSLATTSLLP